MLQLKLIFLITSLLVAEAIASDYGNRVAQFPINIAKRLAEAHKPTQVGAIGRNKDGYFHVRFQRGIHHIADYGLVTKQCEVIARFLTAAEYSLDYQLMSGDFKLVVPRRFESLGSPSTANRASGVAFFASSLGLGIHALETNDWFRHSDDCVEARLRLSKLRDPLQTTLTFLMEHKLILEEVDKFAPNRLLFNALAFEILGQITNRVEAQEVAGSFVAKAIDQLHDQGGYFVEGGGFDSSYNAVALALTLRLMMIGYDRHELESVALSVMQWQKGRVLPTGEVSTESNTRVKPGNAGESFLGRKKSVDVGHVVEAFMLASQIILDKDAERLATKVIKFYESIRSQRR